MENPSAYKLVLTTLPEATGNHLEPNPQETAQWRPRALHAEGKHHRAPHRMRRPRLPSRSVGEDINKGSYDFLDAGGKLGIDDVIVCPIDRSHAEEVVYAARWSVNCSPTLTTHNQYLFVLSVRDIIEQVGDSKREFFRFFTKPERLQLQGFPPKYALDLPEDKIIFAAGNSYPVPLMVACFFPMLESLAESGLDLQRHPSAGMISDTIPACLPMVTRAMAAPGRIVNKMKHMQAQRHKSKRKKRALSEDSI